MKRWVGATSILAILVWAGVVYAAQAPPVSDRLCALEAFHSEIPVYDECIPTSTTMPSTTTTVAPTTTVPPTTTTVAPTTTTTQPFVADPAVLAQIAREPFKASGGPKTAFDIILTSLLNSPPKDFWTAPYKVNLGNGYGWISGDRAGYQKAYMFLVDINGPDKGKVIGRVSFWAVTDSAGNYFSKVNDRYMDEIQTTHIGYDGTKAAASEDNQGQAPGYTPFNTFIDSPEVRPIIHFEDPAGNVIEDRSYTNTVSPPVSQFRFLDGGYHDWIAETGQPRIDVNGFGTHPHKIYFEQTVYGRLLMNGHFWRAIGVEYVSFLPDFPITR